MTSPVLTCPSCGQPLQTLPAPDPGSAPYLCQVCVRGWWGSELTQAARRLYDPVLRCFPVGPDGDRVRLDTRTEAADSRGRLGA